MRLPAKPRVIGALMGDIQREPGAKIKYGLYFDAIRRHFELVDVLDAKLHGIDRYFNALLSFHSNPRYWRERYYKNIHAFKLRSRRLSKKIKPILGKADFILQIGVLFDSGWGQAQLPYMIYTDYTAFLASKTPHAGRSPFNRRQLREWISLEQRSMQNAAHVYTRSELVMTSIINDYRVPSGRVTTVGGGINFCPLPTPVQHAASEKPTALFIGKEFYRKGGDLLLRAFAKARQTVGDARLIFLTGDPLPGGLPLEGVEVIKPTWKREVIADLFRRSHFLVLPSRLETWGDVLIEAMGYGIPCVGVCGQAMEEVIENRKTGLLVPPEDEQSLAEALVLLFNNPELRQQWGAEARQRVETEYTWEKVVERSNIEGVLRSMDGKFGG